MMNVPPARVSPVEQGIVFRDLANSPCVRFDSASAARRHAANGVSGIL